MAASPKNLRNAQLSEDTSETVFSYCRKPNSQKSLQKASKEVQKARIFLEKTYIKVTKKIDKLPFVGFLLAWVEESKTNNERNEQVKTLLAYKFIDIVSCSRIEDARERNHAQVLDAIRSKHTIPIKEREKLVKTYISFINWLSHETYGYFPKIEDLVYERTSNRLLDHALFINFLSHLNLKEQIVAKLLYFGEKPTLEVILGLEIKNINFENNTILELSYPPHVLAHVRHLIGSRKTGRIFLGRQNTPLNTSTIFRNFKKAAQQAGLGKSFCPSALTATF